MSYQAKIVEIENLYPHPNAGKLQLTIILGYQVVIGIDTQIGDIGIFFPVEGQLSEEYAKANDLIRRKNPETGENEGGMFDENRRVRSQKFRGEKSEGYWAPISSVDFCWNGGFDLGTAFDNLNGIPICNKYVTQATRKAQQNKGKQFKRANKCFPKHIETEKLQFALEDIPAGSIIYITEKLHGTSGRYAYVLDEKISPQKWWRKVLRKEPKKTYEYDFLIGTRNMILGKTGAKTYYDSEQFRVNVVSHLPGLLKKGEIIYGEIVGYTTTGASIMGEHDTSSLKEVKKQYGSKMTYSYGCNPGEYKFYVYRISQVNEDGEIVELSWPQVQKRAKELMLEVVPKVDEEWFTVYLGRETSKDVLWGLVESLLDGNSVLDEKHIREGVVLRVEQQDGDTNWYKAKSFTFGVLEGYIKQNDDFIDAEEIS